MNILHKTALHKSNQSINQSFLYQVKDHKSENRHEREREEKIKNARKTALGRLGL